MSARCTLASSVTRGVTCRPAPSAVRCVAVRAEPEAEKPVKTGDTVFYGGNPYTDAEWKVAQETGTYKAAPTDAGEPAPAVPATMGSLMAFDGPAPEIVNGRLAMLGFVAALGAELSSGESVMMQIKDAPGPVVATFSLIALASFVPLLAGKKPESRSIGPFNAAAEVLNGRAAMIGLVSLMLAELFTGGKALL